MGWDSCQLPQLAYTCGRLGGSHGIVDASDRAPRGLEVVQLGGVALLLYLLHAKRRRRRVFLPHGLELRLAHSNGLGTFGLETAPPLSPLPLPPPHRILKRFLPAAITHT